VHSSNIKSVGYKPVQRKLEVEFNSGDVYRYKAVPRTVYKQMMSTGSKGKFLNEHVKYTYPYRKYQDKEGNLVDGEWKTIERKKIEKKAFIDSFLEKLASKQSVSAEEAQLALDKLNVDTSKVNWKFKDFLKGMNVELEHGTVHPATNLTDDKLVPTAKIALAHLNEFKLYYRALEKMEESLKDTEKTAISKDYLALDKDGKKERLKELAYDSFSGIPGSSLSKDDVEVHNGLSFPWNSNTYANVILRDGNGEELVGDGSFFSQNGVGFGIHDKRLLPFLPRKDFVSADSLYLKEENRRKGLGVASLKAIEDVGTKLDASKVKLVPDEDGPLVWGKRKLGYEILENDSAKLFHAAYKKYAKKNGIEPTKSKYLEDYAPEFVKQYYEDHFLPLMLEKNLKKTAALNPDVQLYPHQQRVVDSPETSKIIAHSVGGGKTLTGIAKFEKMKADGQATKALVVVPASLRNNFGISGVGKFTDSRYNIVGNKQEIASKTYKTIDPSADYNIISYEMYRKNPVELLRLSGADTVITDEAHRGKNEGTLTTEQLKKTRPFYKNHIALTGSLISNSVADVQPLAELVSNGRANVGKTKDQFNSMYVQRSKSNKYKDVRENRKPIVGFKHSRELGNELTKYIDYADYDDLKTVADMPDKKMAVKKVPISHEQAKMYKKMLHDDPNMMKLIKQKRLETLKDDEIAGAFSKLIEERKLMNSVGSVKPGISMSESWQRTPKTKQLLDDLDSYLKKTPDGQALLMSQLINGGTDVLEQGLKDKHIDYGTFTGKGNKGVTEESRQQSVKDFNDRKKRVMIVSPAGGEGLSLNDTTYEAVLDPHYNPEKMNQMEARGIRSGGLKGRADRSVEVTRYLATMPKTLGIFPSRLKTPDEVIYNIQENKDKQNQKLYDLMKDYR